MPAGQLRESVAFDRRVTESDGFGGRGIVWSERHVCRAQVIYHRGGEEVDAARLAGRAVYKVKIRSCDAARRIRAEDRMRDLRRQEQGSDGDYVAGVYNVREVDAISDRAWVWLVVEGEVAT